MNILFCGDVVGRAGRDAVVKYIPELRRERNLDLVVVNGDNAAGGFGITAAICAEFFQCGVDIITGGDHIWDQRDIIPFISQEKRLLRPHNFPATTPGGGVAFYETKNGKKVLVVHLLGQVFHKEHLDCPFATADRVLKEYTLGGSVSAILVDFHAEATSEKNAMGQYLDGRASVVTGSHTHIPTADTRILPKGTAYQTDTGMCGDYNSVIGFDPAVPISMFLTKMKAKDRMTPAQANSTLGALYIETDDTTGLATKAEFLTRGSAF